MDLFSDLRELFNRSNSGPSDELEQVHQKINAFLDENLSVNKPLLAGCVPPIDIICCTINNVLYPSFATKLFPDFLDLLTTVESYRLTAVERAQTAITWNEFYKQQADRDVITLTDDEETILKRIENENQGMRKIYIKVLCTCCRIDLYNLWTAHPLSITDFMMRYNEYFPFLSSFEPKSPRLFHQNLSESDKELIRETGKECSFMVKKTFLWAKQRQVENANGHTIREIFQTPEFRKEFPPLDQIGMMKALRYYLDRVPHTVKLLTSMFQTRTSR